MASTADLYLGTGAAAARDVRGWLRDMLRRVRPPSRDDEEAGAREHFEDAALYDFEYRRRRADVSFYRTLAAERGGPILDLACGTGRTLVPLLRDGHVVVGLDRSRAMLAAAAARLSRLSPARRARALLVRADLCAFAFARRFAMALAAFHSVQHLVSDGDLLRFLRAVRQSLRPDGWLVFDILPPDPRWLAGSGRRWGRTVFRHPRTGERLVYTTDRRFDAERRALHMRIFYAPIDGAGRPAGPERVVRLCHRQLAPDDVVGLLARAGFGLLAAYGGFDGRPVGPDADEHVYIARPLARRRLTSRAGLRRSSDGGGSVGAAFSVGDAGQFPLTGCPPRLRCDGLSSPTSRRRVADMAEKVARLGINREKDFMYYVKDGGVWKVQRKQPGLPKGRPEKVADGGFEMDSNYIYFVDKDGDAARAKRAVGGQKRKRSAAPKRKAKAKRAPAKKAAKKKVVARGKKKAGKKKRRGR